MQHFISLIVSKFNAGVAAMFRMNAVEWVIFGLSLLVLFFVLAHPVTTLLLFVAIWFCSIGFRNGVKRFFKKN